MTKSFSESNLMAFLSEPTKLMMLVSPEKTKKFKLLVHIYTHK